ncbi:MAG: tRNA 2-thiocytidine(32) synthetase TtcA [Desulfobacterales bacterium]|nr:tRNA 2-thiocytidine(32) synthetase TtcA [Desulfobacterales bacterium]
MGKALHRYEMIADGDGIVVGLSGGKDSFTLLWMLKERLSRIPVDYRLVAVYVDPGFEDGFSDDLRRFWRDHGIEVRVEATDFGVQAHGPENRENPCFLCSRLRRQRLFEVADELGFKKIALGHHKDDIIETLFMNMFYAGEISTMQPCQPFFQGHFTVIRPLAYTEEDDIRRFARQQAFPSFVNPCPSASTSRRRAVKEMLHGFYRSNKKIKGNLFRAMHNVNQDYLLK